LREEKIVFLWNSEKIPSYYFTGVDSIFQIEKVQV